MYPFSLKFNLQNAPFKLFPPNLTTPIEFNSSSHGNQAPTKSQKQRILVDCDSCNLIPIRKRTIRRKPVALLTVSSCRPVSPGRWLLPRLPVWRAVGCQERPLPQHTQLVRVERPGAGTFLQRKRASGRAGLSLAG